MNGTNTYFDRTLVLICQFEKIFKYRLSRARRCVERTYGILSNKWRIFHRPIDVHVDFAVDIVKSCCVLHNFVHDRDGFNFDDTLGISGFEEPSLVENCQCLNRFRVALSHYFISEERQLDWQMDKI